MIGERAYVTLRQRPVSSYNARMGSLDRRLDDLKRRRRQPPTRKTAPARAEARRLSDVVGGRRATCQGMPFWRLTAPFRQVDRASRSPTKAFREPLYCEVARGEFMQVDPAGTLVMDIETGGFSGTPVFLIGVVALDSQPLQVEQWLARDYPEEEAILRRLARWAGKRRTWVTFNGKSFDAPFVLDRARLHGVDLAPPEVHIDLLHTARRRWRTRLPDCRLETLERRILKRVRVGDVPSCDVPDLFHHFIRTRNAAPLRPVLEHNQVDLVSSRDKRIFNDPTGLRSARNREEFLLQTYMRDTGDILSDLSMPIIVDGRHWGAIRIGFDSLVMLQN